MRDLTKKKQRHLKISFSNGEIACRVLGNGIKNIIVFYGFGQSPNDYKKMEAEYSDYTFYILDLPFHGETKIDDASKPITPKEIAQIIRSLKEKESIDQFSVLGCSIGAKMVYQVIESDGSDLEEVMLFAPDGIRNNFWYNFATSSALMRAIFKRIISNDKLLYNLISAVKTLKIIDSKTGNFALKSVDSRSKREKVYYTWCYFRTLKLNVRSVTNILNDYSIRTTFVVGMRDKIIPKQVIAKLSSKLVNHEIIEVNAGHHNLIQQYVKGLANEREVRN